MSEIEPIPMTVTVTQEIPADGCRTIKVRVLLDGAVIEDCHLIADQRAQARKALIYGIRTLDATVPVEQLGLPEQVVCLAGEVKGLPGGADIAAKLEAVATRMFNDEMTAPPSPINR